MGSPDSVQGFLDRIDRQDGSAFMATNWRKARVPDDVLRGRVGHDEATR